MTHEQINERRAVLVALMERLARLPALEAAAQDFIDKCDNGLAFSRKSYAAFKAALHGDVGWDVPDAAIFGMGIGDPPPPEPASPWVPQVGDRVRLVRPDNIMEGPTWVPPMDDFAADRVVCEIVAVDPNDGPCYELSIPGSVMMWYALASWMEPA